MAEQSERNSVFDIDDVCERIESGETMTAIAKGKGTTIWTLRRWLDADPQRSARASAARGAAARAWDDLAEWEIRQAEGPFELSKAKELAQHYRWRAGKIAPAEYGDKQQIDVRVKPASQMTDDELAAIASSGGIILPPSSAPLPD